MPSVEYLHFSTTQLALAWSSIVLLVVLLCLRQPATFTISSDDKGTLQISRHALHRLIETCCEQLSGVASARADVSCNRTGKFAVSIRLRTRPDAKLDAIQGYLTQEVSEIFRDNLGIGELGKVKVKVVGIAPPLSEF